MREVGVLVAVVEIGATAVLVLVRAWVRLLVAVWGGMLPVCVFVDEGCRVAVIVDMGVASAITVCVLEAVRLRAAGGVIVGYQVAVCVFVGVEAKVLVLVTGVVRVALLVGV